MSVSKTSAWRVCLPLSCVLYVSLAVACDDDDTGIKCESISPSVAIVTDIDETLTTSDAEFVKQVVIEGYVPEAREGSVELVNAYYSRGYQILYLTARPETQMLLSGETAREATEKWLVDLGFPMNPRWTRVILAADSLPGDEETVAYKRESVEMLTSEGWSFEYAYGNATTDIEAYLEAGIPAERVFIIGEHAGEQGTVAISGEGWIEHMATHVDPLERICDF